MPILVNMRWREATADDYDRLRDVVNWEGEFADGGMLHVAAFDEEGAHITDVWRSADHFQRFVDERLMPGVAQVGLEGEPEIEILATHAIFAPAYERASV